MAILATPCVFAAVALSGSALIHDRLLKAAVFQEAASVLCDETRLQPGSRASFDTNQEQLFVDEYTALGDLKSVDEQPHIGTVQIELLADGRTVQLRAPKAPVFNAKHRLLCPAED